VNWEFDKLDTGVVDTSMEPSRLTAEEITGALPEGLLQRVVQHLDPIRIFVFGSRASGTVHQDSDWDLLVVVDDNIAPERIGWQAVYDARRGIRGAIDLIPFRDSNFRRRERIIGSLPWIVCNHGVLIYERSNERIRKNESCAGASIRLRPTRDE
jgi:predicted nucleotidyltransferase